jgi:SHS family sialic acid transporter-like MFS transporter
MGGSDVRRITRGQWLALTAALLGWMFDGFEQGVFSLVGRPALVEVLGLKDQVRLAASESDSALAQSAKADVEAEVGAWMGRVTAAFLFGAALGGWLFGWMGDRLGRVRAMVFSVLTYALFTGLGGLAQTPWQLASLRFLAALGMGGEWALGVALVMESWPTRWRPLLAGLIGAAANVGFILTALVVKFIAATGAPMDASGWRWVMGVSAFPALLTYFLRVFVPESEKWQQAVRTGPRPGLMAIFTPALRGRSILAATLSSIALIGTWGSLQWVPAWVTKETTQEFANQVQIASGIGAVLGAISGALLAHYLGRRWTYFALALGSLLICALLFRGYPLVGFGDAFLIVAGMSGFFTASFYGWLPLYLPELFPTRVRATGQGFGYNFGRILAAAGPLSMGFLMSDRVFHGSYSQAGATISLIYLAGLVVIWLAPETRGQPLPE